MQKRRGWITAACYISRKHLKACPSAILKSRIILLALVIESDERLIERLDQSLAPEGGDLIELTLSFARQIMDHAINNLEKDIWRQVIAAVTLEAGTQLSRAYSKLDEQLAFVLVRKLEAMRVEGKLSEVVNPLHLGRALFQLQNARFVEFISSDAMTQDEIENRLRNDLVALFSVCADQANSD